MQKQIRPEEVRYVLEKDKGSEFVEGVVIRDERKPSSGKYEGLNVDPKAFEKMHRLRLLKLQNVNLSAELEYVSCELCYLDRPYWKIGSLPPGFQPTSLVDLRLHNSVIVKLYNGEKPLKNLKYLDLSHSAFLVSSPDFSLLPNLEEILLVGCVRLSQMHPSIGVLDKLIMLNLSGCKNLAGLPRSISGLASLKYLGLFGCSKLFELPESVGDLQCLEELDVGYTAIEELPSSFSILAALKGFSSGCKGQQSRSWCTFATSWFRKRDNSSLIGFLLTTLPNFCHLTNLDLSNCNLSEYETPIDVSCLSLLEYLDLTGNSFTCVPLDISQLEKLERLGLEYCEKLEVLPKLPANVQSVFANHCASLETSPEDMADMNCDLSFVNCHKLIWSSTSNRLANKLFRMLLSCFKDPDARRTFNFQMPGFEVPEWFTFQSSGDTAIMQLGSDWYNSYFLGIAVCAIFEPRKLVIPSSHYELQYDLIVDGTRLYPPSSFFMSKSYGTIHSKHLWLSLVSRGRWNLYYGHLKGDSLKIKLQFFCFNSTTKVTSCGICPVYSGMRCVEGLGFTSEIEKNRFANTTLNVLPPCFDELTTDGRSRIKRLKLIRNGSLCENKNLERFKVL